MVGLGPARKFHFYPHGTNHINERRKSEKSMAIQSVPLGYFRVLLPLQHSLLDSDPFLAVAAAPAIRKSLTCICLCRWPLHQPTEEEAADMDSRIVTITSMQKAEHRSHRRECAGMMLAVGAWKTKSVNAHSNDGR